MPSVPQTRIVVVDSNVLINFTHVARLDLLAKLPSYEFVVPDNVLKEIVRSSQRQRIDEALSKNYLREESVRKVEELALYADLSRIMGRGEAACLAMAKTRGWFIASDEKRKFRREVMARLGQDRIITTAGLARISHTRSSRSGGRAGLTRRATEVPANVLLSTLRRPTERNAVRSDHCAAAVEGV